MKKQWKTLARPMFSMNFWIFLDSGLVPGDSLEKHQFEANLFNEFWWLYQTRTLTKTVTLAQDASKGGVPQQRLLKKTLVNGGGVPYVYIYIYIYIWGPYRGH